MQPQPQRQLLLGHSPSHHAICHPASCPNRPPSPAPLTHSPSRPPCPLPRTLDTAAGFARANFERKRSPSGAVIGHRLGQSHADRPLWLCDSMNSRFGISTICFWWNIEIRQLTSEAFSAPTSVARKIVIQFETLPASTRNSSLGEKWTLRGFSHKHRHCYEQADLYLQPATNGMGGSPEKQGRPPHLTPTLLDMRAPKYMTQTAKLKRSFCRAHMSLTVAQSNHVRESSRRVCR